MTYVVTGGAGFIGSNLVQALNQRGIDNILVVDDLTQGDKFRNLVDAKIADYLDLSEFLPRLEAGQFGKITALLHQGACSDTMNHDGRYMLDNNYRYSLRLLEHCQAQRVPFLYASSAAVYGASTQFVEDPAFEAPLNVYGYSKLLFDQVLRQRGQSLQASVVGLRYFNVYGPREQHKGRMASVAFHHFQQFKAEGTVKLFEASHGYPNGGQERDFVYIDDVCQVNLYFLDQALQRQQQGLPPLAGVFNCGTGRAQPFNDIALTTVNTVRVASGASALSLDEMVAQGLLHYVPFPPGLKEKYQAHTQADLTQLRAAGYSQHFMTVQQGVERYVTSLMSSLR